MQTMCSGVGGGRNRYGHLYLVDRVMRSFFTLVLS